MKIIIKKVEDPFCFWGVSYSKCGISSDFADLKCEIDNFYNNDQLFKSNIVNPEAGMRCIVDCKEKGWQRSSIVSVLVGCSSLQLSCYLVDDVSTVYVPITRVYATPAWVWRVKTQGIKFGLDSILPLSLAVDYCKDEVIESVSASNWNISAKNYFKKLLRQSNMEARIQSHRLDENGQYWGEMIIKIQDKYLSVNYLLVAKKYAVCQNRNITTACTVKPIRNICDVNANDVHEFKANFSNQAKQETEDILKSLSVDENIFLTSKKASRDPANEEIPNAKETEVQLSSDSDHASSCNKKDINSSAIIPENANDNLNAPESEENNSMKTTKELSKLFGIPSNSSGFTQSELVILALENMLQKCKTEKKSGATLAPINNAFEPDTNLKACTGEHDEIFEDIENVAAEVNRKENKTQRKQAVVSQTTDPSYFYESGMGSKYSKYDKSPGLFVKGIDPPKPISLFCATPFRTPIIDCLQDTLKFRGPTLIQAHVWPSILEHRNLMTITPTGSGKTLSYVVPLVSLIHNAPQLSEKAKESLNCLQIPFALGRNPKVIVLCSTWKKVQAVSDYFELFFDKLNKNSSNQHKVLGIFGGPYAEKARSGDLVSGCSVLVCSPFSLLRICKDNFVSLLRLSHLVLDDIHVLVEDFTAQIQDIMKMWVATLNDPDRPSSCIIKPQVLGFGSQWTDGVKSFMRQYMERKPILYISHPLEAAVYGQVQNTVLLENRSSSFETVRSIIDFHKGNRKGGIAVFVKTHKALKFVAESLKVNSIGCIEVHQNTSDYEISEIQQMLDVEPSSCPVLVVLDSVTRSLHIDSIQICIHYEFPDNKLTFGLRLSTMQHFYHMDGTENEDNLCSYLILTEDNKCECVGLLKFLKRFKQPIPRKLSYLVERYIESSEVFKMKKSLCEHLQAFGSCGNASACQYRHFVSSFLDAPNSNPKYVQIPTCGHIKILVKNVTHATHFYGLITKLRDAETNKAINLDCIAQNEHICKEMNQYFGCPENCIKFSGNPDPKVVLATKIKNQFHRVKIIFTGSIGNEKALVWITPAGVCKVKVQGVDNGAVYTIHFSTLLTLPEYLSQAQYQAIEFRIAGVQPIDKDREWLPHANDLVHNLIFEKEIEGNIIMSMGHTLWLHPVVIRKRIPKSNIHYVDCNVVNELLASGLAERNDSHIEKLKKMMKKGKNDSLSYKEENTLKDRQNIPTSLPQQQSNQCPDITPGVGGNKEFQTPSKLQKSLLISIQNESIENIHSKKVESSSLSVTSSSGTKISMDRECKNSSSSKSLDDSASVLSFASKCSSISLQSTELDAMYSKKIKNFHTSNLESPEILDVFGDLKTLAMYNPTIPSILQKHSKLERMAEKNVMLTQHVQLPSMKPTRQSNMAVSRSIKQPAVELPLKQRAVEIPLIQPPVEMPLKQPAVEMPLKQTAVEMPLKQPAVEIPLKQPAVEMPLKQTAVEMPLKQPAVEMPLKQPAVEMPLKQTAVEMPLKQPAVELPLKQTAVEIPLKQPAVEIPLKQTAVEMSLKQTAVEIPLKQPSVEMPLKQPDFELPLKQTANEIPLKQPDVVSEKSPTQVPEELRKPDISSNTTQQANNQSCTMEKNSLHSYCVEYIENTDASVKLKLCHLIYITCSELGYCVTQRDLENLFRVWEISTESCEKRTFVGAFLHLANCGVPLCDSLNMDDVVSQCMMLKKSIRDLALMLAVVLAKHFPASALENLTTLFCKLLVERLNKSEDYMAELNCCSKILTIVETFLTRKNVLVEIVEDLELCKVLKRLENLNQMTEQISSFYRKCATCSNIIKSTQVKSIQTKIIRKKVKKPTRKYDSLNYDRFNDIDTDSCCSMRRPYSPIYSSLIYDADTDLSDGSNDTDCFHEV